MKILKEHNLYLAIKRLFTFQGKKLIPIVLNSLFFVPQKQNLREGKLLANLGNHKTNHLP